MFRFAPAEPIQLKSVSIVSSNQFQGVTLYKEPFGDRIFQAEESGGSNC